MEGVVAEQDARAPGRRAREFHRRLHRLRARIAEERLVQPRRVFQQSFGEQARQNRHVHLHEIRQVRFDHADQRARNVRMIAPERENAPARQQVEIAFSVAIPQILPGASGKADVVADRLQHAHHLLVEMAGVQRIAFGFASGRQRGEIERIGAHGTGGVQRQRRLIHAALSESDALRAKKRRARPGLGEAGQFS